MLSPGHVGYYSNEKSVFVVIKHNVNCVLFFPRREDPRESSAVTTVLEARHDRRRRRRRTAAAAAVRHSVVGHVLAGLRRRHDGVRTGYRVRVHGSRRPARQHTRHADAD